MKKKLLALIMAATMTFGTVGMSTVVFAEDIPTFPTGTVSLPQSSDKGLVKVQNVESGRTVTAYQIVEAKYRTGGGFTGYKAVDALAGKGLSIANPMQPKSDEVANIVAAMNDSSAPLTLKNLPLNPEPEGSTTYTGYLNAGYWIVIVSGGTSANLDVYNPMLVGVWYSVDGNTNTMASQILDASSDWSLNGDDAWAKKSDIEFEKTANLQTANWGETVEFDVTAQIPEYSTAYETVKFIVRDKMTNLDFVSGSIEVSYYTGKPDDVNTPANEAKGDPIPSNCYTINPNPEGYDLEIAFDSEWIKKEENGGKTILVEYKATTTEDAVNEIPHKNAAELEYTNDPSGHTLKKTDDEKVYTFDIDGGTTAEILRKVAPGTEASSIVPLKDAEFTLYTDISCDDQYKYVNSNHTNAVGYTAKSDENGKLYITGLAAGTYYLKETKAPANYTLNDNIYKIEITAEIDPDTDVLSQWSIKVTDTTNDQDGSKAKTSTFTVGTGTNDQGEPTVTVTGEGKNGKGDMTDIMNTTISRLPSTGGIGTTIFTIGGCAIMIAAAGIFFVGRKKEEEV